MLLSKPAILEHMGNGNIVIEPFNEKQLGTNSYDVRLGEFYYKPTNKTIFLSNGSYMGRDYVDFTDEDQVKQFWIGPYVVNEGDILLLEPGETILAHTEEAIGGRNCVTTSMRSRSSIVRCGLSIAKCGGLGDVGYVSRWTMEISNHNKVKVALRRNMRVGQIEFYQVEQVSDQYAGKYGSLDNWKPEDMLPKLYKDWDFVDGKYVA
jgi:dCTP deaminase